jgi:hypothetical protein
MSAVPSVRCDYVTEWIDELHRVAETAAALSPAARAATIALVDSFAAEDGVLPQEAYDARLRLAATPGESLAGQDAEPERATAPRSKPRHDRRRVQQLSPLATLRR